MVIVSSTRTWTETNDSRITFSDEVLQVSGDEVITGLYDNDDLFNSDGSLSRPAIAAYILSNIEFDTKKRTLSRKTLFLPRMMESIKYDGRFVEQVTGRASRLDKEILKGLDEGTDGWLHETFAEDNPEITRTKEAAVTSFLMESKRQDYGAVQVISIGQDQFAKIAATQNHTRA